MACDTRRARIGSMVSANRYRNPELLADMARTVDHLSGGRLNLGIGAGNSERDHQEYGYSFGTPADRLRALAESLPRLKQRPARLNPPPLGPMPILIAGGGEQVTLKLTARFADMWNGGGPPDVSRHKNRVLDAWCGRLGRDPSTIQRTINIPPTALDRIDDWVDGGAQLLLIQMDDPFDMQPVEGRLRCAVRA
jgi:alkanesulfonate monooxygenase SsuD/methylene tetrahydromethanopterin reductase-like flavin-dependent oxidoreductase (luciferase family)